MKEFWLMIFIISTLAVGCRDTPSESDQTENDTSVSEEGKTGDITTSDQGDGIQKDVPGRTFEETLAQVPKLTKRQQHEFFIKFFVSEEKNRFSPSEKVELLLKFDQTEGASAERFSGVFHGLIDDGYELTVLREACAKIPPGQARSDVFEKLYSQLVGKDPEGVWEMLNSGELETGQSKILKSRILLDFVGDVRDNGGPEKVQEILKRGLHPENSESLEAASVNVAIVELGKLEKFPESLLTEVLNSPGDHLDGGAYQAWVLSLPVQEMRSLPFNEFPEQYYDDLISTAAHRNRGESLDFQVSWIQKNVKDSRQKKHLKSVYQHGITGDNMIEVIQSIESQDLFESLATRNLRKLKNPAYASRFPNREEDIAELEAIMKERGFTTE